MEPYITLAFVGVIILSMIAYAKLVLNSMGVSLPP